MRVVTRKRMARCAHIVLLFLAALSAVHAHTTVVGPLSSMPAVPVREHSYTLGAPNFTIVERHSTPGAFQRRPEFRGRGDTPLHCDRLAGCTVPDDPRKQSPDTLPTQEADVRPDCHNRESGGEQCFAGNRAEHSVNTTTSASMAGASQGVRYILSPRNWGIYNGRFNSSEALRACATYSSIGVIPTITAMLFDYVYAPWLLQKGLAVRTSEYYISAPWQGVMWDMFSATMITMVPLVAFGTVAHAGALWPIVFEYGLKPFDLLWATMLMLLVHDAYYYFLHRALHANRWLYKHVHAHHHDPRVMLEARTGLIITCWESILGHCIPYAFTLAVNMLLFTRVFDGVHFANIPTLVAPMIVSTQLGMIGHSGMRYSSPLVLVVLNPLFACLLFTGTAHSPTDHQYHHERGRYNLSLYFRHWDDWCGTHVCGKGDKRAAASPLLLLYNMAYYLAVTWTLANAQWVVSVLVSRAGLAALCCAVLMPASTTGWTWFRRLPVWDVVREAYACRVMCCKHSGPLDPEQKYVFGYHPHGRLARGLWLVFGLTGRKSPVSGIRVSLPVVNTLLSIPVVRHVYGILGGCALDKNTLVNKLKSKKATSIAIAPGGLSEARFKRSNKVVLSKRLGFVRLAMETGAQLVPVLGVGEENVGGAYASTFAAALLLPAKRVPVHVVIGKPLKPQPDEDLAAFHARYVAALVDLGKQHGVSLEVL